MRKCTECGWQMQQLKAKTPENVDYNYYKCKNCGEEIVDMKKMNEVAKRYCSIR